MSRLDPQESLSSTFVYFLKEASRRMWISKRTSFVAIAMIAIALITLGGFLLIAENLTRAIERWEASSRLSLFLADDITQPQIEAINRDLSSHRYFASHRTITRQQALARFKSYYSGLSGVVDELDENPFPASIEVQVTPEAIHSLDFDDEVSRVRRLPGVADVQYDWEWVAKLKRVVSLIDTFGILAGGVLAIAAAFTIASVIRLTMVLYREEIDIMRLVGATERIVRGPFLMEGILAGTTGGVVAVITLYGIFEAARYIVAPASVLAWQFLFSAFLPWQKIVMLLCGGILAGLVGTWLSLREVSEEAVVEQP
ncbi:MAG: ABC transporter permease [Thermoanaerobaculia bacterium]